MIHVGPQNDKIEFLLGVCLLQCGMFVMMAGVAAGKVLVNDGRVVFFTCSSRGRFCISPSLFERPPASFDLEILTALKTLLSPFKGYFDSLSEMNRTVAFSILGARFLAADLENANTETIQGTGADLVNKCCNGLTLTGKRGKIRRPLSTRILHKNPWGRKSRIITSLRTWGRRVLLFLGLEACNVSLAVKLYWTMTKMLW